MFNNVMLQPISNDLLQSMKAEWIPHLDVAPNLPETHYERIVSWGENFINGQRDKNAYFYALSHDTEDGYPRVLAVMDLTHKHPHIQDCFCIKVMAIHVAPQFDFRQDDTALLNMFTRRKAVSKIASELLVHAIDEMIKLDAAELKVYGNHHVNIELFELLCADLEESILSKVNLSVDSHNNWLVIKQRI